MIKIGKAPYLECSSKGDRRFSAFYARLRAYGGKSIEEIYQGAKKFADGTTGLSPRQAKGKKAINMSEVAILYDRLWWQYLQENKDLIETLKKYQGYSDMFGRENCQCQAKSIYKCMKYLR